MIFFAPVLGAVFEKSIYVIALDRLLYREMIKYTAFVIPCYVYYTGPLQKNNYQHIGVFVVFVEFPVWY